MKITRSWKKCNIHEIIRQLKPEWFFCRVKHWNCVCQKYSQHLKIYPIFLTIRNFHRVFKTCSVKGVIFTVTQDAAFIFYIKIMCISNHPVLNYVVINPLRRFQSSDISFIDQYLRQTPIQLSWQLIFFLLTDTHGNDINLIT